MAVPDRPSLRPGDLVPHFQVRTVEGQLVAYRSIWQHRNLVLIALPANQPDAERRYLAAVEPAMRALQGMDTTCVLTRDPLDGVPAPGVLIADRWGEIAFSSGDGTFGTLPPGEELIEWVDYVRRQCPECQGEAR